MKNSDLLNAMNEIEDEYVLAAEEEKRPGSAGARRRVGFGLVAAACLCLVAAGVMYALKVGEMGGYVPQMNGESSGNSGISPSGGSDEMSGAEQAKSAKEETEQANPQEEEAVSCAVYALVQAQYPECAAYPSAEGMDSAEYDRQLDAYFEQRYARREQQKELVKYQESLSLFYEKTMPELLVSEEDKNRAYSPLNLYMALSMLAELTGGNSRTQLLALLNAQDMEAVRESAAALWKANYMADGIVESRLANSIWLKQGIDFVPETINRLADTYYASAFQGDTASPEFTGALQQWLNEQTGGLLQEQAAGVELEEETLLALASTVYFRAQWADQFDKEATKEGIFHAASGDMACDFMHQKKYQEYFRGSNFSAVCRSLSYSGGMWLMLPDEGVCVNEVLQGGEILRLIGESGEWEEKMAAMVNLAMPKFDIVSDLDLKESLKALGVTDVFDSELADFGPMAAQPGPYLDTAKHAARVAVDEEGCMAAAFTVLAVNGEGMMQEQKEIDFVLDRPFVFAITGEDGSILFLGVVEKVGG